MDIKITLNNGNKIHGKFNMNNKAIQYCKDDEYHCIHIDNKPDYIKIIEIIGFGDIYVV